MALTLASALRYLDGIYRFRGSEVTTDQIDLSAVQLVHDVAGIAAASQASGPGGYAWGLIGATAANNPNPLDLYGTNQWNRNGYTVPSGHGVWIFGVGALAVVGGTTGSIVSLRLPPTATGPSNGFFDALQNGAIHLMTFSSVAAGIAVPFQALPFPQFCPPGSTVEAQIVGAGEWAVAIPLLVRPFGWTPWG